MDNFKHREKKIISLTELIKDAKDGIDIETVIKKRITESIDGRRCKQAKNSTAYDINRLFAFYCTVCSDSRGCNDEPDTCRCSERNKIMAMKEISGWTSPLQRKKQPRKSRPGLNLYPPPFSLVPSTCGSPSMERYGKGCRCDDCQQIKSEWVKREETCHRTNRGLR